MCNQLPAVDTDELSGEFVGDYNDTLMVNYLASITKGTNELNDLAEKFNMISTQRSGHHRLA